MPAQEETMFDIIATTITPNWSDASAASAGAGKMRRRIGKYK